MTAVLSVPLDPELQSQFKEICKNKGYKMNHFYARLLKLYLSDPVKIESMMQERENRV